MLGCGKASKLLTEISIYVYTLWLLPKKQSLHVISLTRFRTTTPLLFISASVKSILRHFCAKPCKKCSPFPKTRYAKPVAHYSLTWSTKTMAKALLGISPGTRIIGLAVMCDGELVEWKVKTFKATWSGKKRTMILEAIERMRNYYGIEILAIKKIDPLRSSPQLDMLLDAIYDLAKRNKIELYQYSLSDLDYDDRPTKRQLSERIAGRHPKLRRKLLRERSNRTEYHTKMFEAVAMAERCNDE